MTMKKKVEKLKLQSMNITEDKKRKLKPPDFERPQTFEFSQTCEIRYIYEISKKISIKQFFSKVF